MKSLSHKMIATKGVLKNLYLLKKLSSRDIGKIYGCSGRTILNYLKQFQIPIRSHAYKGRKHPKHTKETRKKMSRSWDYSKHITLERNNKISKTQRERAKKGEWHGFTSFQMKQLWKSKAYREHTLKKIRESLSSKPNKAEMKLFEIIEIVCPNEYIFVGDGSFTLYGYSPDFKNVNGQKKLIELFGDYWHEGEDERNRIFLFKLFGYDTLIIWKRELRETENLKVKIMEFNYV